LIYYRLGLNFRKNEILNNKAISDLQVFFFNGNLQVLKYNKTRVQRVEVITSHSSKQPLKIPTKQSIADPFGNQCLKIQIKERKRKKRINVKKLTCTKAFFADP
jgi:hypothetical protein